MVTAPVAGLGYRFTWFTKGEPSMPFLPVRSKVQRFSVPVEVHTPFTMRMPYTGPVQFCGGTLAVYWVEVTPEIGLFWLAVKPLVTCPRYCAYA